MTGHRASACTTGYSGVRPACARAGCTVYSCGARCATPDESAYYFVFAPVGAPAQEIVRTAGTRWSIEDFFKLAKGQVGLDHYEVRSWQGWYRHMTLALWALALLAAETAGQKGGQERRNWCRSASPNCAAWMNRLAAGHPPSRGDRLVTLAPPAPSHRPRCHIQRRRAALAMQTVTVILASVS